jgi:PGF-pre-PGF domain-containing protein
MTPGSASVVKYTDSTLGIKQISIEVNNAAQNVQVSVTKEAGKPAAVSVAKSGKIYQYIHIETTNLADKLNKATVQFKVEKSWATANNVDKNNVVASKFDETNKKWNELTTTYVSEDSTHYYYNVELDSFSYFVLSDKTTTVPSEEVEEGTEEAGSLTWLWIVIAVVIIIALWYLIKRKK